MEQIITAVLSLVFVLGLVLIVVWLLKWLQLKGADLSFCHSFNAPKLIKIIEQRRLDHQHQIVIFETQNHRYLLIIGGKSPLLLSDTPLQGETDV
ncbi:MAG: hypothetical protein IJ184_04415 [Alphaproteobacteria bacterium]|nr:hypothetical protein [Alphaproteobacteria bacterium]